MAAYREGKFTRTVSRSTVRVVTDFDTETLQAHGYTLTVYGVESDQIEDFCKKRYGAVLARETARDTVKIIIKESDLYSAILGGTITAEIVPANTLTEKGESTNE